LNECERVQGDQAETELGRIGCPEGRMEGRGGSRGSDMQAGDSCIGGVLAGGDKGSGCAPRHGQRPGMGIDRHAAQRCA
jgi:hypothetical protein